MWLALTVVGLQYALVLAFITAIGELVPYVGPLVAGTIAVAPVYLRAPPSASSNSRRTC